MLSVQYSVEVTDALRIHELLYIATHYTDHIENYIDHSAMLTVVNGCICVGYVMVNRYIYPNAATCAAYSGAHSGSSCVYNETRWGTDGVDNGKCNRHKNNLRVTVPYCMLHPTASTE
jgi:hypothetical protein